MPEREKTELIRDGMQTVRKYKFQAQNNKK